MALSVYDMDKRGKLWYNTPYYGRLCPEEESGMGKLIVFEGTDGSGKATQSALLCPVSYTHLTLPTT